MKKTLVIGASENQARYAYKAVKMLREYNHPVIAVGLKEGKIDDVIIHKNFPREMNIDTVTMYVGPQNQSVYYDYILELNPKRIIFNPGAENPELEEMARAKNIEVLEACTLVMLSVNNY